MSFHLAKPSASSAKTVNGQTTGQAMSSQFVSVGVDVTAFSGTTPTLDLIVEWSFDNVNWSAGESPLTFAQILGIKSTHIMAQVRAPYMRVRWTLGGTTPSFTFTVYTYVF